MGIRDEITEPLVREQKIVVVSDEDGHETSESEHARKGHPWMVYFTTFVAVCGSYEFGTCVSP